MAREYKACPVNAISNGWLKAAQVLRAHARARESLWGRLALLALYMFALIAALWAGLLRLGWSLLGRASERGRIAGLCWQHGSHCRIGNLGGSAKACRAQRLCVKSVGSFRDATQKRTPYP